MRFLYFSKIVDLSKIKLSLQFSIELSPLEVRTRNAVQRLRSKLALAC